VRSAQITGWGRSLPPAILTNADLATFLDTSDDWIVSRSGIKERHISHVRPVELGRVASLRALAAAGVEPDAVDLVLVTSSTPDSIVPATSNFLQDAIGASRAGALDVNVGCAGFVYGLAVAAGLIKAGGVDRILLCSAEKLSWFVDWTQRNTAVLFGDGAAAVLLEATEADVGMRSYTLGSDGSLAHILEVPGLGSRQDMPALPADTDLYRVTMDGQEVFRRAVEAMKSSAVRVVEEAGWGPDEIDLFISHQANQRIIDATARRLRIDERKVFSNIASYGNTSSASIPIALTEALECGRIPPFGNVVFAAFGAGLAWGAATFTWGERVTPLGESDAALPPFEGTALDLVHASMARRAEFTGIPAPLAHAGQIPGLS